MGGSEVAIRLTKCPLSQQLTCESPLPTPPVLLKENVIPSASEGSPSPVSVLSKTDPQRIFFKYYILCDLLIVVISSVREELSPDLSRRAHRRLSPVS